MYSGRKFRGTLHSESMPSFNTTLGEEAGVAPSDLYEVSVTTLVLRLISALILIPQNGSPRYSSNLIY